MILDELIVYAEQTGMKPGTVKYQVKTYGNTLTADRAVLNGAKRH